MTARRATTRALTAACLLATCLLVAAVLPAPATAAEPASAVPAWDGAVMATDEFEYSYSTETRREIVENWLDVAWQFGGFRTGVLLNARQPSEEGARENTLRHRFCEFGAAGLDVRAGHFYGLFGRGLLFAAYEDRRIRVDTALDGVLVRARRGRVQGAAFTGTPSALPIDVRGLDAELEAGRGVLLGVSGLTWRAANAEPDDNEAQREWVCAPRLAAAAPFGDCYFEYGWKKGWDYGDVPDDRADLGQAFYGSVNLYRGPLALAVEAKDYKRFTVLRRADGRTPLNNPPSLTREHLYTLLNRSPHATDADDERGWQAELTAAGPAGWSGVLNASRAERRSGELRFAEVYAQVERERRGPLRWRGAFGYRDSEGLRQTAVAELTWFLDDARSLSFEGEHQHVRPRGGAGFDPGAYDEELVKLEYAVAPAWAAAAMLEANNKYELQRQFGEKPGPFPAVQVSYVSPAGARLALWAGKRQAGYLCAGGVCKYEPAFEGVELTGTVRY